MSSRHLRTAHHRLRHLCLVAYCLFSIHLCCGAASAQGPPATTSTLQATTATDLARRRADFWSQAGLQFDPARMSAEQMDMQVVALVRQWRLAQAAPSLTSDTQTVTSPLLAPAPLAPPAPQQRALTAPAPQGSAVVYVTKTGKKYHRADCEHLSQSKIAIGLAQARAQFEPCRACDPPR